MKFNIIIVQPAFPHYRLDFFESLAREYSPNFVLLYAPDNHENNSISRDWATQTGKIVSLGPGLFWQKGVLGKPLQKNDILVVPGAPRCLSNIMLLIKAKLKGARVVWWGHYWSSTTSKRRLALRLFLMRFSDALLFYTDQEVTEYSSRVASLESRTVLALNNGLNTSRIAKLRRSYDAQDRLKSILFIGRLTKKSNIQLLVGAMASPLLSDARLQIIGDGELRYDIQEMIEALGISDRITLHGSLLCEEFIAEIANLCRVFVYPGEVGLSLIHAMAYGLPAVVHSDRWGHMPEIAAFENGVTGLQFEKDNRESLIVNLVKLLDDVHLLNRQSISSVSTVSSSFNVQDMVLRFKQLVEKVRVVDS